MYLYSKKISYNKKILYILMILIFYQRKVIDLIILLLR